MECTEHYCNSGSLVCGHLLNEGTRGSQIFVVPRSGNYTVTIAGASGGHGVCSNYSGLGVIARETVQFRRGQILRILVGQQGTNACDGHQNITICQISNTKACENSWLTLNYNDLSCGELYYYDGGGGGGGASLLQYHTYVDDYILPIAIAPGGGGAGAIYDVTTFLSSVNIVYNDSDDLEALYRNYTCGHAFDTNSKEANGTIGHGIHAYEYSAGPGAGYDEINVRSSDAAALISYGFGGLDCNEHENIRISGLLPFPDTHGGFGGGGGGCNGGGGGYTGGSIIANGAAIVGEGGYSYSEYPWLYLWIIMMVMDMWTCFLSHVVVLTIVAIIYNQSLFECSYPSNTLLAVNGLDCYTEGFVM